MIVVQHPKVVFLIIPLIIGLFLILRKNYLKQKLIKVKGKKRIIFVLRILFMLFLLIALSNPYSEKIDKTGNFTKIKVLIDNSDSMKLFNTNEVIDELNKIDLPLEINYLDFGDYTSLGNAILNHLSPDENLLLITDGQNNFGANLKDVSLFASSINSKLFAVILNKKEDDANIIITGPGKVVSDVENSFFIKVNEVGSIGNFKVKIYINNEIIFEQKYEKEIEIKKSFRTDSIIKAVIEAEDYILDNNAFYKSITVHDKPKILFVSKKNSPLVDLYKDFYDVKLSSNLDLDIDSFHAVVLNDLNKDELSNYIDKLEEYLNNENGLMVIGGKNSYDWGDYNKSLITNILPVQVGKAKKKNDISNIAIVMDTGASSNEELSSGITYFDVQKSLSADIVKGISSTNRVMFIEANYYLNTLSKISDLGPKRDELIEQISLLFPHGLSELRFAYQKAHKSLKLNKGSKNIIIITDGKLIPQDQALTIENVKQARKDGIKTFIVGIGESADESFLQSVKEFGGGEYFRTNESHKLKIYFGDPGDVSSDKLYVFIYDSNHFITNELDDLSNIYGFNSVYPKSNSRLLLTTSLGDPVLTVWNYGLGRVAALSTDDGSSWIPDLLKDVNSKMFIKTLNWLVENPERKNNRIIEIPELRLGENSIINVRSKYPPIDKALSFTEIEDGLFQANYFPIQQGLNEILGNKVAVNYKKEYLNIGMNSELSSILKISNGELLDEINPESLISLSKVETTISKDLSWIFVMFAIIVYLIEVFIRRMYELNSKV